MAKDVTVASGLIGAEATGHSAGPLFMRVTPAVHTVAMLQMDVDRHAGILRAGGGRSRSTSDSHGGSRSRREEIACGQAWSHPWRPLAGPALLERLRVTGRPRPKVDPEFVFRLRCHLDAELATDSAGEGRGDGHGAPGQGSGSGAGAGAGAGAGPGGGEGSGASGPGDTLSRLSPLVVTKDRLTRVLSCEAHYVAAEFGERTPTPAMACGAIVDVLFRQLVCVGSIGDPMADGLAALSVDDHQRGLLSWIEQLLPRDREGLRAEVERQAEGLQLRWPALESGWLPRTQEAIRAQLAGGSVELSARVDLAIGRPAEDEASVAIVEIKSGARRPGHRADLHFYALVEALRSWAPPFVVATYYTRTGELDVDPVTDELLVEAARRTLIGARALRRVADGIEPVRSPGTLCGSCAVLPECGPGRERLEGLGGRDTTRGEDR